MIAGYDLPDFLSPLDRLMLTAGAWLSRWLPGVVMPLARRRMRAIVGDLVVDADPARCTGTSTAALDEGFGLNVNLLGEAVLGEREADRPARRTIERLVVDPTSTTCR